MNNTPEQKIKISVYGTQHMDFLSSYEVLEQAKNFGKALADRDIITMVSAVPGFAHIVAKGAFEAGGQVIGFSPAANEREHVEIFKLPTKYMEPIVYSGFGYAGSDLLISRSSDAVIFGYGGLSTVHEFWVAFQEHKPIGIFQGIWKTDEILYGLLKDNPELDHEKILFDNDMGRLIDQLVKRAKTERVQDYHV